MWAGVLVVTVGPGVALLVGAATFAVSVLALAGLVLAPAARVPGTSGRGVWRDVVGGARLVGSMRWLCGLLVYGALLQAVVIGPHMVAGPLLAAHRYGGARGWAAIGVAQAVGSIAGGVLALRWRPRRRLPVAVAGGLLMAPYLLVFACGGALWLVCVLAVGVGVQGSVFVAVQATQIQQAVPEAARSRVAACSHLGNLVLLPVSLAVTGPLVAHLGAGLVLLVAAGWLITSTVLILATGVLDSSASGRSPRVPVLRRRCRRQPGTSRTNWSRRLGSPTSSAMHPLPHGR